jgi:hypothetical protein
MIVFIEAFIFTATADNIQNSGGGILSWLELTRPTSTITLRLYQVPYRPATRQAIITSETSEISDIS